MKVITPSVRILTEVTPNMIKIVEYAGRRCYMSEMGEDPEKFITGIAKRMHHSVLEHLSITVEVVCDRGVTHEWVRHRLASYSQESSRYCNYSLGKFGNELTFIKPLFWKEDSELYSIWERGMLNDEKDYLDMISKGAKPQEARDKLPNSIKTTLVCTMNLREWLHFFKLRCAPDAHPQMRECSVPLLEMFQENKYIGFLFDIQQFGAKENYNKDQIEFGKFDYVKCYDIL